MGTFLLFLVTGPACAAPINTSATMVGTGFRRLPTADLPCAISARRVFALLPATDRTVCTHTAPRASFMQWVRLICINIYAVGEGAPASARRDNTCAIHVGRSPRYAKSGRGPSSFRLESNSQNRWSSSSHAEGWLAQRRSLVLNPSRPAPNPDRPPADPVGTAPKSIRGPRKRRSPSRRTGFGASKSLIHKDFWWPGAESNHRHADFQSSLESVCLC